jgi:hypothetical protein
MTAQWTTASTRDSSGRRRGGIVLIVVGSVLALIACGLLVGGGALMFVDRTQRDSAGYLQSPSTRLATGSFAVAATDLNVLVPTPGWHVAEDALGKVRISASSSAASGLFLGIAANNDVRNYLTGVGYSSLTGFAGTASTATFQEHSGGAPGDPAAQTFWAARAAGTGTQSLSWQVQPGQWAIVLMNADTSRGVTADVSAGATAPFLFALALGLMIGGALLAIAVVLLLVVGARMLSRRPGAGMPVAAPPVAPGGFAPPPVAGVATSLQAVRLEGRMESTSRWLWLVKWFLLIPHVVVLAFLFLAAFVLTLFAFCAILFTGRYPRSIFDLNVGVLRWSWRVGFYGYSALGTDRYPPFSLSPSADQPATFDVRYPEHLSRPLVLVKWLLAIPHYVVIGVLAGAALYGTRNGYSWVGVAPFSGLIGLLVFIGAVVLLFSDRYPRGIFDLAVGLDRWVYRVLAYTMLMTDAYPPFRLDMGEQEPHG